jgi:hypothetical protein
MLCIYRVGFNEGFGLLLGSDEGLPVGIDDGLVVGLTVVGFIVGFVGATYTGYNGAGLWY